MTFYTRPLRTLLTKIIPKIVIHVVFKYGSINVINYQNLTYVKPFILCMRCFEVMISAAVKSLCDHAHVHSEITEQDLPAYLCHECKNY
jgi:hypothetical protein